ncbi:MAG: glycosyltransferase family 4 protein [Dehalococcoidia bacterium]
MKIALVSPYDYAYPGGVTIHVTRLAEQFLQRGHQVKVLAPSSQSPQALGASNLFAMGKPLAIPSAGTRSRITLSLRLLPKVRAILREENFDIVHLQEPLCPSLPLTVLEASKSVNVGTFHAYHGSRRLVGASVSERLYHYLRYPLKRWFNRLHGKIAVSKSAGEFVGKHLGGEYHIIPNGIDLKHFSTPVPPIEELRDDKINILFMGRLEKRKGLKYLLGAYTRLKWEFPQTRLLIAGPGKLDDDSEKLLGGRNANDVVFIGQVPYENLPLYYQAADIFCAPATGKESFGMVLLEAMASAKPIVASNIGGYAGVMTHGVEGFLVKPKSEEALASALGTLIQDKSLREQLGARGRLRAEGFSWVNIADRVMDYYLTVLDRCRSQAQMSAG